MSSEVELLGALVGTWATEGRHPLLADAIHGRAAFEWLAGERFLVWRSQYDHPDIPDALAVLGVMDDRLSMQYFDVRGVHRVYSVAITPTTWRFWRDDTDFRQRFTGTFDDSGGTITGHGELSHDDGGTWDEDLSLTYRRIG
jgi:hypothetical protein